MIPLGVVYPHDEIEPDVGAVRAFAQGVEQLGYSHVIGYDHVLGANAASRPNYNGLYRLENMFHEPLVMFGYMAGATAKLGFMTGILILPQRQAVLVAKQVATLDLLCQGRLRIGVGTGWNEVEYEALGCDYASRGERLEEQVEVLRQLWSQPAVTFSGRNHTISDAGINPMPVQRPVPIWMGGGGDRPRVQEKANPRVLRRIARMADGWIPMWDLGRKDKRRVFSPDDRSHELLAECHGYCREYGRDPATLGLEGRSESWKEDEANWVGAIRGWLAIGATHFSVNTMFDGLKGADQHLERLAEYRKAWDEANS